MAIPIVETDFLIVGAGPAGASLACFLGQNGEDVVSMFSFSTLLLTLVLGLNGITISSAPGTADTPRAHVVNPFAVGMGRYSIFVRSAQWVLRSC